MISIYKCLDCHCKGILKQKDDKVYLFPDGGLSPPIDTRKNDEDKGTYCSKKWWRSKCSIKKHGNSTDDQKYAMLCFGLLFWLPIMFIGGLFEKNIFKKL